MSIAKRAPTLLAILASVLLATAFGGAADAAAPRAPASERSAAESEWQEGVSWLINAYASVIPTISQILDDVRTGAQQAYAFKRQGKTTEGEAWARAWAPVIRTRLKGEVDRVLALPVAPPPPPVSGVPRDRREYMIRSVANATTYAASMRAVVSHVGTTLNGLIDMIARMAGGDASAERPINVGFAELNISMLDAQAERYRSMVATGSAEGSPQESGLTIMMHGCTALAETQRALLAEFRGEPFDTAVAAKKIEGAALAVETAAVEMDRRAKDDAADTEASADSLDPDMLDRSRRAYATYDESVAAGHQLAAELQQIAQAMEAGDMRGVESAGDHIVQVFRQIGEIDDRRRAIARGR